VRDGCALAGRQWPVSFGPRCESARRCAARSGAQSRPPPSPRPARDWFAQALTASRAAIRTARWPLTGTPGHRPAQRCGVDQLGTPAPRGQTTTPVEVSSGRFADRPNASAADIHRGRVWPRGAGVPSWSTPPRCAGRCHGVPVGASAPSGSLPSSVMLRKPVACRRGLGRRPACAPLPQHTVFRLTSRPKRYWPLSTASAHPRRAPPRGRRRR